MSEKDNVVAQEVTAAPSLKALHALILDGDLTDAARMCDQLMAEQERREVQAPLFYFNPKDVKRHQSSQSRFDCGSIPVSARADGYYTTPLYTAIPSLQGGAV